MPEGGEGEVNVVVVQPPPEETEWTKLQKQIQQMLLESRTSQTESIQQAFQAGVGATLEAMREALKEIREAIQPLSNQVAELRQLIQNPPAPAVVVPVPVPVPEPVPEPVPVPVETPTEAEAPAEPSKKKGVRKI